uniref:putative disease resistance protein At3g14460 n=1 Tax=Erigeron canadensis TaxID=72917 RepID=UPI001CB92B12|nr:putative disease resistance protein At3g14460 [Erigeron canadensis]XP_043623185.1 putative disease resistance protein At3g14460 [Erigeron canadensis]
MAEIVLSAFLGIVFEKVASAAINKVARSKKIQSHLKKLESSLPNIQALLNDAAEKEIIDKRVKNWLNRLQHLAYDIDDILDSLATDDAINHELTEESQESVVKKVKRKLIPTCCTSSFSSSSTTNMHHKLNDIITKLQELYEEKSNLGLTVKDKKSKNINRIYQTSLFDSPNSIVGREAEKEIMLQKLLGDEPSDQNNFSIIPIVGMGGIGKTTLARLLYNEPKVKQHFELRAWVCVSDEFDSFSISKVIYEATASEEKKEKKFADLNLLQEALRDQLMGKQFLLVLDDVWSERIVDWNTLVPPFHAVAPGSKIIITTRKTQLLQQLGNDNPYELNKLSQEDALSLFAQHALGATNFQSYPTLRLYGEGIVRKCDGLPLALKSLGSLLRTKTNEEKWKELLESEIWSLKEDGGILPALRLSYLDLSACLKQLFAYSCLFPKDYTFEKEDLIFLWMAEGFLLESSTSKSMECLGEEHFDELLSRSFFQHVPNDESLFMMHDLMNDLATSVAGEFFIRLDIDMVKDFRKQNLEKYRHMSFVCGEFTAFKKLKEFERANSLRTFLAVPVVLRDRREEFHLPNKILVDILPQLPLLRTLCLSKLRIHEVPESVGDLKHLRYLNLSRTQISNIPEKVCSLHNLQTLIVFGCYYLSELPNDFIKLRNLRHFDIRDTPLLENMPLGIGDMKSLQTFSQIVIGGKNEFPISRLKHIKNLRQRVCIHVLDKLQDNDQVQEVNLSQMKLRELVVRCSDVFDGSRNQRLEKELLDVLKPHRDNLKSLKIMSYGGTEFPKWVGDSSLCRLTVVNMYKCRNCVVLPPLGQLPSLRDLSIDKIDDVKKVGSEFLGNGPAAFPSLEILRFSRMTQLEVWSINAVGVAMFPCLKQLYIRKCPRWEVWSANADVTVFPCLQELAVSKCPSLVKVSLESLPSLRVVSVSNEVLLTSLVSVASSITKLTISGLIDDVWGGVVQYFGAIEKLSVNWCQKLVRISRGEREKEGEEEGSNLLLPASLKMLDLNLCRNLKYLSCRDSIETLNIYNCENLEHLSCPANNIQDLRIGGCSSITSVSFPTGGGGGWQKLKSLYIWGCNSLLEKELEKQVLIIINNTTNNMPILEILRIHGWKDLQSTKFTYFIRLMKLEIEDCERIESFPDLQDLVSLKRLRIFGCRSMDSPPLRRSSGVTGVWPPKLDSLSIGELKRPISEWGPLPNSLVELYLWGGFGSEEEHVKIFPASLLPYSLSSSLTTLELFNFREMEIISSEGLQHLTSLQHLSINHCPKLKDLPEMLLPSLLSLYIYKCTEELKEKLMSKRGSYWPLLSHIPQVDISYCD